MKNRIQFSMNASVWRRDTIYSHASVYEKWYTYNLLVIDLLQLGRNAYTSNKCMWIFYNTIDDNEGRELTIIMNANNGHGQKEIREIGREGDIVNAGKR